jgi:hypothetical protein
VDQYGETKLPDSVLIKVMVCLAKTREPGGLRGFACVAKDLANASLVGAAVLGAVLHVMQPGATLVFPQTVCPGLQQHR